MLRLATLKPQVHFQETISNQACTQYNIKLQHVAAYFMFKLIYSFHLSGNWNVPSHYFIVSLLKKRRMTSCTKKKKMLWLIVVSIGLNCLLETQYHTFRCQFRNVRILPCCQFRGNRKHTISHSGQESTGDY